MCRDGNWDQLTKLYLDKGKDKGTATNFTNQDRFFFEDSGLILWITFIGNHLCWGFLEPGLPSPHDDGDGVWRKVLGGWRREDLNGEPLSVDRISGAITQLTGFRGTSCGVTETKLVEYVVRRINGQKRPEVERALLAIKKMNDAVAEMMSLLNPYDFQLLVDLVFSTSGWRRQSPVGKTQKTIDMDLILPSTGERAFVQVKSNTDQDELDEYVGKLDELFDDYHKMFFVHHAKWKIETKNKRVIVIGPEKLAEMVVDAGLASWLIRKVS